MNRPEIAQRLLYGTYTVLPIVAGIDKFFNYLANWHLYLNPTVPAMFNAAPDSVVHGVGLIEIVAGLLVLFMPRFGSLLVSVWLLVVSINLISMGSHVPEGMIQSVVYYDIAVRDIGLAVGAFVLSLLS